MSQPFLKCDCKDWQENISKLISAFMLAANHKMEYDGKFFKYCPWCAKPLKKQVKN